MEINTLPFNDSDLEERKVAWFLIFVRREDQSESELGGVIGRVNPKMSREDEIGGELEEWEMKMKGRQEKVKIFEC